MSIPPIDNDYEDPLDSYIMTETESESGYQWAGIPFPVFILLCAMSLLGVAYAVAIMIFNLLRQRDKIIKMTSPNMNVIVLLGACLAYGSIVMLATDSSLVSLGTMAKLVQTASCLLPISFTLIFGSVFAKSWRVFMIFKNINVNSKSTRDEHILLGVCGLLVIDLAIILPWSFTDHIECTHVTFNATNAHGGDVMMMDLCKGELLAVWMSVIYVYKAIVFIIGLYFTWQTRHVTLPALRDSTQIYISVYTTSLISLTCLPLILTEYGGVNLKSVTGALAVWFTVTATISLLFVPKILLWRAEKKRSSPDTFRFQFTESMKKTQEAMRKCALCFCCSSSDDVDKYASEVLSNEIETLKRSNKEKDTTIRELTDRLYFGTEKFQEYLTTPKRQRTMSVLQAMHRKHARRTRSTPVKPLPEEEMSHGDYGRVCNGIPLAPPPTVDRLKMSGEVDLQNATFCDEYGIQGRNSETEGEEISSEKGIRRQLSFQDLDISVMDAAPSHHDETSGSVGHNGSNHSASLSCHSHDDSNDSVPDIYHDSALRLQIPLKSKSARKGRTNSPNQDSAIDNNSPSIDSSEAGSDKELALQNHNAGHNGPSPRAPLSRAPPFNHSQFNHNASVDTDSSYFVHGHNAAAVTHSPTVHYNRATSHSPHVRPSHHSALQRRSQFKRSFTEPSEAYEPSRAGSRPNYAYLSQTPTLSPNRSRDDVLGVDLLRETQPNYFSSDLSRKKMFVPYQTETIDGVSVSQI